MILEKSLLQIDSFAVTVLESLGQQNGQIRYFKVNLEREDGDGSELGLLRVGSATGLLQQELQLRESLGEYALVAPLLAKLTVSDISEVLQDSPISTVEESEELENEIEVEVRSSIQPNEESLEEVETTEGDYLEEEYYPEEPLPGDDGDRLLLLTAFPEEQKTLTRWLDTTHPPTEILTTIAQLCQLFWYFHQNQGCAIDLDPDFIEIRQPIRVFDLTNVYPEGTPLNSGLMGTYVAPELASNPVPEEKNSTYTIGALLYCALLGEPWEPDGSIDSKICAVPRFSQLLELSLSPVSDDRFSLEQLRSLLIETRNELTIPRVTWETASDSTVGLSPRRLHNEDSYGILQWDRSQSSPVLLAALADGMGGMAAGEVASRVAVETVLEGWRETDKTSDELAGSQRLVALVEQANLAVSEAVENGGTTLSVVLAESRKLSIAHVGDSRIYLIKNGEIRQLSEDHSLVALLVASGQISLEESQEHPDRNVLTKSLGSKKTLASGYVQSISDIELQDGDIILLCSDGVWDFISNQDFLELFEDCESLNLAVKSAIQQVLKWGAPDNATLLALRCRVSFPEVRFEKS
ncbi:protein phosphatase 2C domain-containing protein [Baaleninema sp.]|uniref:protein phosphatase 2C domain-containing protein n=1 Tax=Baaleninema sp. TaxID=3101197 RepID=UPI003D01F600